ncbi:MAG: glycoside hydrolase family 2 protein, partial [Syntrophothermus sp.]
IANIQDRKGMDLSGKWQYIVDMYENGYYDYRWTPDPNGFFRNAKPEDKTDRIEYDFDKSPSLNVPGDWNTQDDRLFFYEGTVWYKKSFDYSAAPGSRQFIGFGAVNYDAKVFLNGKKLGEHTGGFTPFSFEVTGLLKEKDNFLIVKADNKRLATGVPTLNTDWWNYGGITRSVRITEVPSTFIRDYFVQLKKGSLNEISGWVMLDGKGKGNQVKIDIPEAGISKTITADDSGYAEFTFKAKLKLWSPEDPKLYECNLSSGGDAVHDLIGFRSIETKGTDILLNGKPVYLRGISIHEEAPLRTGRANTREDAEILLSWAKELGCNFVRLAHYPHNEAMVRAAEKMGLMVWSEIPVYWTIQWENRQTLENASKQLSEMITRDKNRANIILWSVSNETPLSQPRLEFLKSLISTARKLDPTRLMTAAMERHYTNETTQMIDDPLGEFLDVLGCNEYIGWYDGLPDKALNIKWETSYNKPVVVSEFGADAQYNLHGDRLTRWSEEYQEDVYKKQIEMLKKVPFIKGMSPWILMDFRSPRRLLPGVQDYFNRKGLISDKGNRKKAFFILQNYYKEMAGKDTAVK